MKTLFQAILYAFARKIRSLSYSSLPIIICTISLLTTSCSGKFKLEIDPVKMENKTIHYSYGKTANFTEETFQDSLASAAAQSLNDMSYKIMTSNPHAVSPQTVGTPVDPVGVKKFLKITDYDPIEKIVTKVSDNITQDLKMKSIDNDMNADYSLYASSSNWGIRHHPIMVLKYSIKYSVFMTLTENATSKSKTFWCRFGSDHKYSYEDIYRDYAEVVKQEMDNAYEECSNEIYKDFRESWKK